MILKVPAKINLALDVKDLRPDGYHNIDIVSIPLELHDSIEIEEYPERFGTYLTSDDLSLICDESNLVYVAYRAVKRACGLHSGFRIKIFKKIPMEAGLAGGSADAAAVINGLIKMKKLNLTSQQKIDIAKSIGSDVPYCLFNKPTRITGMGENLQFIDKIKQNYGVLLVKPEQGLSTKAVYKDCDHEQKDVPDIPSLIKGLQTGNEDLIVRGMANGLQKTAIDMLPEIGDIIKRMKDKGLKMVMMSGSGSAVFALSKDQKLLETLAPEFDDDTHEVWVTRTAM